MNFKCAEDELLALLTSTLFEAGKDERIKQLLSEEINWTHLLDNAFYHGVYPLVYANLKRHQLPIEAEVKTKQLEPLYRARVSHNFTLTAELVMVLKQLQANNIRAIPLKGPVLTQLIYGDIGLRLFSDLDILVPRDQIDRAKSLLLENGYQYTDQQTTRSKQKAERKVHHYNLIKDGKISLELHWRLEPSRFSIDEDTKLFWENTHTISCFGMTVTMPRNEEMLLYLCRHGSRHLWRNLKWLYDIVQFLRTYQDLDWQYISTRVERSHTKRLTYLGFYLARQLYGTVFPTEIERQIEDPKIERSAFQISEFMFTPPGFVRDADRFAEEQLQLIRLREGRLQRLRYLSGMFQLKLQPNAIDRSVVELPSSLSFFYYVIHTIRLTAKYSGVVKRLVLRKLQI